MVLGRGSSNNTFEAFNNLNYIDKVNKNGNEIVFHVMSSKFKSKVIPRGNKIHDIELIVPYRSANKKLDKNKLADSINKFFEFDQSHILNEKMGEKGEDPEIVVDLRVEENPKYIANSIERVLADYGEV